MPMNRSFPLWLLVTTVWLATHSATARGADRKTPDHRLQGAYRVERNGWVSIHLEGPPERIGYQHGYLLAEEIADFLRVIKPYLEKSTQRDWGFYRRAAEQMLWKG